MGLLQNGPEYSRAGLSVCTAILGPPWISIFGNTPNQLLWVVGRIRDVPILGVIFIGFTVMFAIKVISSFFELGTLKAMKATLSIQFDGSGIEHILRFGFHVNRRFCGIPKLIKSFVNVFLHEVNRRANLPAGFFPFRKAVSILFHGSPVYNDWEDWLFFLSIEDLLANKGCSIHVKLSPPQWLNVGTCPINLPSFLVFGGSFRLEKDACARGCRLHDFFLYDWRDEKHPTHATMHAGIALKNAHRYCISG